MIKNKYMSIFISSIIFTQFVFSDIAFSQQIQMTPPQGQTSQNILSQPSIQGQLPALQQAQPQSSQQPILQQPPAEEKTSGFEEYIAEKVITISEDKLEILKRLEGVRFAYISRISSYGEVSIPIRVVKEEKDIKRDIDAGFLIGMPESIQNAFKIIGMKDPSGISTDIKQFGYALFSRPPSSFAPIDKIPVGPDYVLGPGDEIRITVWGKVEGVWNVTIDRDGKISLPKIGVLGVTGLTFKELKDILYKELSRYYTGFEMNVSMENLRTLRVYIVGNAEKPGAYTVSSLSTLINALFEAGGPNKTGTMRDVQLKRNGKVIVNFDIYDFLLKGDKTKDVRLMPEDVIFIPTVGTLVGIAGNVKVPAIYELKGETRLLDLINMAGGLNSIASKGRLQVQRVEGHQFRTIFESDLINMEKSLEKNFPLKDGDMVKIFSVIETRPTVTLTGAVANPGEYGIMHGATKVKDIISLSGGLLSFASNQAEITRLKITQSGPQIERFTIDPFKAVEGLPGHNIPLEVNDNIFIKNIPEWELYRNVNISGEVRFPGAYIIKKGERLSSLIERAGGFTDKAYLKGAVFTRESVRIIQQKSLDEAIDRIEQAILAQTASSVETAISGEAAEQKRAAIEQRRELLSKLRTAKAQGRLAIKIDTLEKLKGTNSDLELEDGDTLNIPAQPSSVTVIGAIFNQNSFLYDSKSDIAYYIKLAGGATRDADEKSIFILKVDGTALSKRQEGWGFMSKGLDPGDTIVVPHEYEKIAWLREIRDLTAILYQVAITTGVIKAMGLF
jgi:protein involved in polysaccharide export with SLBB domain